MELLDARRLTGANVLGPLPAVIVDVACTAQEAIHLQPAWRETIGRLHRVLGWPSPTCRVRTLAGGLSLGFDCPIDHMYSAVALGERAFAEISGQPHDPVAAGGDLQEEFHNEQNPALLRLQAAAAAHQVPLLWDDDEVSIGHGAHHTVWLPRALPDPSTIDWASHADVPIAMITGTNGKTTTARMTSAVLRQAGLRTGLTSTTGVSLDDEVLDEGDYSGPGGARMVLRHPELQAAVLETARGGLLRRGLGVERAKVAVITNIAADHLGDFGSRSLQELLDIKWLVSHAVQDHGVLVLNADDALLVARAEGYAGRILWFSAEGGDRADWHCRDGMLYRGRQSLCQVEDIPLTLGGAARHNIANALAAAAAADALGIDPAVIVRALTAMPVTANPGRGNRYRLDGVEVLVDFAHNPHAMQAIADMVTAIPARRRLLAFSQAGDRTDELVRELTRIVWSMQPERVIYSELEAYARGRQPGELFAIVRDELEKNGARRAQIDHVANEHEALERALAWARPGDLLVMIVLAESTAIGQRLATLTT